MGRFYNKIDGKWYSGEVISLPDGTTISEQNKENTFGWEWLELPPFHFQGEVLNETLLKDIDFGKNLILTFLADNRLSAESFNPEKSMGLLQKFAGVKALAEVGDIKNVKLLLSTFDIDATFTKERKDKYILMCDTYING